MRTIIAAVRLACGDFPRDAPTGAGLDRREICVPRGDWIYQQLERDKLRQGLWV